MKNNLNISIFGEKNVGKSKLIKDYITEKNFTNIKEKGSSISFIKPFRDGNSMKLNLYEFSDIPDKKLKDIAAHQCIIIMFDMTSRKAFEDVLDKWIKFLREIKYNNSIILFGTINYNDKNAFPMTDEAEIKELIEVVGIKGSFHDIGNNNSKEKNALIDNLIETSYEEAKNNVNKKDCIIF